MTALLLNGDYRPLKVLGQHKAVRLVLKQKATVVVEGENQIRSGGLIMPEPKVLHLNKYIHVPEKSHLKPTRRAIMARDNNTCQYCGGHATTIEHIVPRSKGGVHTWDNVVACCGPCNFKKADKFLDQLGWELTKTPKQPSGSFWILIRFKEIDPTWEAFLGA